MKFKTLLSFFLFAFSTISVSATSISFSGTISANTTWNVDTVKIIGDVDIASGAKLIIAPGTRVEFQGFYKFYNAGSLQAIGNVVDSISFTYYDTTGLYDINVNTGGWRGLNLDYNTTANDSCILDYCKIEFSKLGLQSSTIAALRIANTSRVRISHCRIHHNNFFSRQGGIICLNASPLIYNNLFDHLHSGYGGAISIWSNSGPIVSSNIICNNLAEESGGGIFCDGSSPIIVNNIICNNSTLLANCGPSDGSGGIRCTNGSFAYIGNNVIANNSTGMAGGGIQCLYGSDCFIVNNTIANNYCTNFGGGIEIYQSNPTLRNNIFWGNIDNTNVSNAIALLSDDCDPTITNNCIEGAMTGLFIPVGQTYTGNFSYNISTNPNFILPSAGYGVSFNAVGSDWRLQTNSLCINNGNSGGIGSQMPAVDMWGDPRISGWQIDIGAFEDPTVSSVAQFSENSFSIYPNPSNGDFVLNLNNEKSVEISIYNMLGEKIYSEMKNNTAEINLSNKISNGVYLLEVVSDGKVYSQRIIVAH